MILGVFKSGNPLVYLLFPVIAVLIWIRKTINGVTFPFYPGEANNLLYAPIDKILTDYPVAENILSICLVVFIAVLIQIIAGKYSFIRVRTMLPGSLYLVLLGGFPQMLSLHPVYFAAIFFLMSLYRLLSVFDKPKPYSAVFDAGFLYSIGLLFYFNAIVFLPVLLFSINLLSRDNRWREYIICLIGVSLPVIFGLILAFVTGKQDIATIWFDNFIYKNQFFNPDYVQLSFIGFTGLILMLASNYVIKIYNTLKISSRKYYMQFFVIFVFAVGSYFAVPGISKEIIVIALIPVTYLLSYYLVYMKSIIWDELIFTVFAGLVTAIQVLPAIKIF